ncbi:MAG: RNA polymerase sigma factor [Planctomycetota bacterium]|jgi:RNA polymerase sigma factor (sigma-70 family)
MDDLLGLAKGEIKRLWRYIERRVSSVEESEDILQEVFLALIARWNLGEKIEDSLTWLFGAAHNKIVDVYRRRARTPISLDRAKPDPDLDGREILRIADSRVSTPEEEAEREELRKALISALEDLPPEQREVFLLTEIDGLSYKEIEVRSGVAVNTLLSRKRYAVLKLRKSIAKTMGFMQEE